jgi:hypothetical protein
MKTVPEQYVFDFLCEISALLGGEAVLTMTGRRKTKTGRTGARETLHVLARPAKRGFSEDKGANPLAVRKAPKMMAASYRNRQCA